jgi:uncharacterized repeat protein (TIGR02059 family)
MSRTTYAKLPSQGDANWGTPLVDFLLQTRDAANGGGMKKISKIADRPSASTLNPFDVGLTYLHTRTGNFHVWNGSGWQVVQSNSTSLWIQGEGMTNILDYGDAGSATGPIPAGDDSAIFELAKANPSSRPGVFLPAGHYKFKSVNFPGNTFTLAGETGTYIYAAEIGGFAFEVVVNSRNIIQNVTFRGNDIGTLDPQSSGIRYKYPTFDLGHIFENVVYEKCYYGILMEGCYFSEFYGCKFYDNEFAFFSTQGGFPYTGFNFWKDCIFERNRSLCMMFLNNYNSDESATRIEHCTFKDNLGTTFLANLMSGYACGLEFNSCKFINNVQKYGQNLSFYNPFQGSPSFGSAANLTYPHNEFVLLGKVRGSFTNCDFMPSLNGLYMRGGNNLIFNNTALPSSELTDIDGDSFVSATAVKSPYSTSDVVSKYPLLTQLGNLGATSSRIGNGRSIETRAFKNLVKFGSFLSLPDGIIATGAVGSINYEQNIYKNRCLKIIFGTTGDKWSFAWDNNSTHKKFAFHSYSIKSNQVNETKLEVGFETSAKRTIVLKNNFWQNYSGICKTTSIEPNFSFVNKTVGTNTTASIMVSKLQIVEFDTHQEALNYMKSNYYALPEIDTIRFYNEVIPTDGSYVKGDIIHNSNPQLGSNFGWVCTTSGTPGAWKGLDIITMPKPKLAISASGAIMTLTYTDPLNSSKIPPTSSFSVVNGTAPVPTVSGVAVSGNTVTLSVSPAITDGALISLGYTNPGAATGVQDSLGNLAPSFGGLKSGPGFLPLVFSQISGDVVVTGQKYTGVVYTLLSLQTIPDDGSVEFTVGVSQGAGLYSAPQLVLSGAGVEYGLSANKGYFNNNQFYSVLISNEYGWNQTTNQALVGDRQRVKRINNSVVFQFKRSNSNTWNTIATAANPTSAPLSIRIAVDNTQPDNAGNRNFIGEFEDVFATGIV